jgi:hypothetical protein
VGEKKGEEPYSGREDPTTPQDAGRGQDVTWQRLAGSVAAVPVLDLACVWCRSEMKGAGRKHLAPLSTSLLSSAAVLQCAVHPVILCTVLVIRRVHPPMQYAVLAGRAAHHIQFLHVHHRQYGATPGQADSSLPF